MNTNIIYALYNKDSGEIDSYSTQCEIYSDYILFNNIKYIGKNFSVIETSFDQIPVDKYIVVDNELQKITPEEPTPEEPVEEESKALLYMIATKCEELNKACNEAIVKGVDAETSKGIEHFSLTDEDQTNIIQWYNIAKTTGCSVPYHSDTNDCRPFTAEEMISVGNAATYWITYNLTYCNQLKKYVQTLSSVEDIFKVTYGVTQLEGEFLDKLNENMNLLTQIG